MKTDELIALLAAGDSRVAAPPLGRRYVLAGGLGALAAFCLLLIVLHLRRDLDVAVTMPMFWVKLGYVGSLVAAGLWTVMRLSRPGVTVGAAVVALLVPMALMALLSVYDLAAAAPEERAQRFWGDTWRVCPLLIAMLSLPVYGAIFRVMQDMAPTQPRRAGAAAGFLSGAIATAVYCLHCPEMAPPFIGFWYLLGMSIPTLLGAWHGGRRLRW